MNLSDMGIFGGIEEAQIQTLLQCLGAVRKHYRKGEVILREGEPVEQIGVVLSGLVLMESSDAWGNRSVWGRAVPGAVFAEAYACAPGGPLLISVTAAEETEALFSFPITGSSWRTIWAWTEAPCAASCPACGGRG